MIHTKKLSSLSPQLGTRNIEAIDSFIASINDTFSAGKKADVSSTIKAVSIASSGSTDNINVLEAHRKYIDLHYVIEGTDNIAYKPLNECSHIKKEYDDADDYILFNETPAAQLTLASGEFCLIPTDFAHMALYGKLGDVRKLVFKVPVSDVK